MEPHKYYEQVLFSAALTYALEQGYYFGEDCEDLFRGFLEGSVNNMFQNKTIGDAVTIVNAKLAVIELVKLMIAEINAQNKLKRLRESSFAAAITKFCPRHPLC